MANTALSHVSPDGKINLSGADESYIPALGDGTAKPGDFVGKVGATGKVVQADAGASELFIGILAANRSDSVTVDTAIANGTPCHIVVPRSGRIYACHIEDPAGTEYAGQPYALSDTAGTFEAAATFSTAGVKAVLAKDVANADVYGVIRWL